MLRTKIWPQSQRESIPTTQTHQRGFKKGNSLTTHACLVLNEYRIKLKPTSRKQSFLGEGVLFCLYSPVISDYKDARAPSRFFITLLLSSASFYPDFPSFLTLPPSHAGSSIPSKNTRASLPAKEAFPGSALTPLHVQNQLLLPEKEESKPRPKQRSYLQPPELTQSVASGFL